MMRYNVLWTKQIRKKVKTYHDGFVTVSATRHAKLLDANGTLVLCSATLPRSVQLAPDVDGIDCFEGFLVNCLEPVEQQQPSAGSNSPAGGCADGSLPAAGAAGVSRLRTLLQGRQGGSLTGLPQQAGQPQRSQRSALVPVLKRRRDGDFHAPRPVAMLPPHEHTGSASQQQSAHAQQLQQQHVAIDAAKRQRRRSDDDILQAFGVPMQAAQGAGSTQHAQRPAVVASAPGAPAALPQAQPSTQHAGAPPQPCSRMLQLGGSPVRGADSHANPRMSQQHLQSHGYTDSGSPWSLGSADWSDLDEPTSQVATALVDSTNEHAADRPPPLPPPICKAIVTTRQLGLALGEHAAGRPPPLPPLGRKALPSTVAAAPVFAAPRMQLPRPAAQPAAGHPSRTAPLTAANSRESLAPAATKPGTVVFYAPAQELQRSAAVPDSFQSLQQYQRTWSAALAEEAGLRFAETAGRFHHALHRVSPSTQAAGPAPRSQLPHKAPEDLQSSLRRLGLLYYADAKLVMYDNSRSGRFGGKGQKQEAGGSSNKRHTFYLELLSGRERSTAYRKGDLWAISNNPRLAAAAGPGSTDFAVVAQSCWHGPNAEGRMEVELLGLRPPGLTRSQPVFALHGPNAATELGAAALLQGVQSGQVPLLVPLLATKPRMGQHTPDAGSAAGGHVTPDLTEAVKEAAAQYRLNEEQAAVLAAVEGWSSPSTFRGDPVVLVHGPFGSGKTTLLVALIMFLRASVPSGSGRNRVLVAAHTNAAVDRILLGLAAHGCTDFLRVGSLPRIDKGVLPHSLHAASADARSKKGGAAAELKDMLAATTCPHEAAIIRKELAAVEAGAEAQRKRRLRTAGVVGTTCCAALTAEAVQGIHFDVVVLDEAAQVVEPLALAPILRSGCRFLVAAGDPCQLPPLIASPQALSGSTDAAGLSRSLFERLVAAGLPTHLLRRQYRCHPSISAVPNRCFYGGRLLDGVSAAERPPLLPGCPPVAVLDVRGSEVYDNSRSASNPAEAQAVKRLVRQLVDAGAPRSDIGVICFFRAQVRCIQATLGELASGAAAPPAEDAAEGAAELADASQPEAVQVATVDSFQGMEKAAIILSTAVTRPGAFASDACRLNVALTRAQRHLFIVGAAPTLQRSGPALEQIVGGCRGTASAFWPDGRLLLPAAAPVMPAMPAVVGHAEGDSAESWQPATVAQPAAACGPFPAGTAHPAAATAAGTGGPAAQRTAATPGVAASPAAASCSPGSCTWQAGDGSAVPAAATLSHQPAAACSPQHAAEFVAGATAAAARRPPDAGGGSPTGAAASPALLGQRRVAPLNAISGDPDVPCFDLGI